MALHNSTSFMTMTSQLFLFFARLQFHQIGQDQFVAYFEDEYGLLVDHTEGLGSALALLEFDDVDRNDAILESTYTTEYGIPCLWPQFKYSANVWEWRVARHYRNG